MNRLAGSNPAPSAIPCFSRQESSPEDREELEMRGPHELIDRRYAFETVAAADQLGGVACEGGGVAGYRDDPFYHRHGERFGLPDGAGARRIEHRRRAARKRA